MWQNPVKNLSNTRYLFRCRLIISNWFFHVIGLIRYQTINFQLLFFTYLFYKILQFINNIIDSLNTIALLQNLTSCLC